MRNTKQGIVCLDVLLKTERDASCQLSRLSEHAKRGWRVASCCFDWHMAIHERFSIQGKKCRPEVEAAGAADDGEDQSEDEEDTEEEGGGEEEEGCPSSPDKASKGSQAMSADGGSQSAARAKVCGQLC